MKSITDLKIQRANYIKDMETLVNNAKEGQRDLSADESTRWSQIDADIKKIDTNISVLERQDELNKSIVDRATVTNPEAPKDYHIGRAVYNFYNGKQGLEIDVHNQLRNSVQADSRALLIPMSAFEKRAVLLKSTDAAWEPTSVQGLSIIQSANFLTELGVTFLKNQTGNIILPNMAQTSASFVNESADMSEFTVTQLSDTLAPRRVAGYKDISLEYQSANNPELFNAIVMDLVESIYRQIAADIYDNIDLQVTAMTSRASGDTAEFISAGLLTDMEAAIDTTALSNLKYVSTLGVKGYAKKTAFLANQAPIWANNEMNGYGSFGTGLANTYSGATKNQLILGDFSKIVVAEFAPAVQVLLDPFTNGLKNYLRVIVSLPVDTGIWNKSAFSLVQNVKTA